VLESVYGVGTDITVSQEPAGPSAGGDAAGGPPSFDFGANDGATTDGSTQLSQARLTTGPGSATFDDTALASVAGVSNVSAATATLSLTNINFSGEIPDFVGITAPYEPPPDNNVEVKIQSNIESVEAGGLRIFQALLDLTYMNADELKVITGTKMKANPKGKKVKAGKPGPKPKAGKPGPKPKAKKKK